MAGLLALLFSMLGLKAASVANSNGLAQAQGRAAEPGSRSAATLAAPDYLVGVYYFAGWSRMDPDR